MATPRDIEALRHRQETRDTHLKSQLAEGEGDSGKTAINGLTRLPGCLTAAWRKELKYFN